MDNLTENYTDIAEYVEAIKSKDYTKAVKFIYSTTIPESDFFTLLFSELENIYPDGTDMARAILELNEAQYKAGFVSNQRLNICALTIKLMAI